jgi:quercetin dioxygenase-like cupin family protein
MISNGDAGLSFEYPRVYASGDGESHFETVTVEMASGVYVPGIPLVDSTRPQAVTGLTLSHITAGYDSDWHNAPRRQFVLVLSGTLQVTVSDGQVQGFGPGSLFFVEDTTGKGHMTRAVGTDDAVWAAVAAAG